MMNVSRALGIAGLIVGAFCLSACPSRGQEMLSARDTRYAWALSKGPQGEYDPAALPLYQAIIDRDPDKVRQLLDQGMSPNAVLHPKAYSPLMLAILVHSNDIADLLVTRGADLNYTSDDLNGTALAVAIHQAMVEVIRKNSSSDTYYPPDYRFFWHLVDAGADINLGYFYPVGTGTPQESMEELDVAEMAADQGQTRLVNELLARGYRHNLPRLRESLKIRIVSDETQPEKDKALATIDRILAQENGAKINGRSL